MSQTLETLVNLLTLEPIEENLFRGASHDLGYRQLFGGQVLGQSLSAACQTVEPQRQVHSLHGYFLRAGDAKRPVVYQVERMRDGGSFSARRITAIQKGQIIFCGMASFQEQEQGFEHQILMPDVPGPDNLLSDIELIQQWGDKIPERVRERLPARKAIQLRPVGLQNPIDPRPQEPFQHIWLRTDGTLPAIPALHRYLLAYASDFFLVATALLPHAASLWQKDLQMASLDHALWFHREVKADEWLLYSLESPWAGEARGLARGHFFNQAGQLVASVTQEGLIRKRKDWA